MLSTLFSGFSKAGKGAKPIPTKTTVEAVNAMNGTPASMKRNSLRSRKELLANTAELEHVSHVTPEPLTRTSPRKRKEPPTEAPEPSKRSKLGRPSIRATGDAMDENSVSHQKSHTNLGSKGQRSNIYDHPVEDEPVQEETAPKPTKQKGLNKKAKSRFDGVDGIDLPAAELIVSSSPAQSTRSHDKTRKVGAGRTTVGEGTKKVATSQKETTTSRRNHLADASGGIEEADKSVEPEVVEPPKRLKRGRPSKGTKKESVAQPAVDDAPSARNSQPEPVENGSPAAEGGPEEEQSTNEAETHTEIDSTRSRPKGRAMSEMTTEERMSAVSGVEDAISLYACSEPWTRVWVNAMKVNQHIRTAKSRRIKDVIGVISRLKDAYKTISEAETSAEEIEEAETIVSVETKQLQKLHSNITAIELNHHSLTFVEHIHELLVPRMSTLMKFAIEARYDKGSNILSIHSLKELLELMRITLGFREVAEQAANKPKDLTNEQGYLVLRLAKEAMASLKIIKKKYSEVVKTDHDINRRMEEARRREADTAETSREQRRAAAIHQQRLQERNETYRRKLREEKERAAMAARQLREELAEQEREWKQALMANRSSEAGRLREKLGLGYRPVNPRPKPSPVRDTIVDIDDFELDSDFEPVRQPPTRSRPNGVHHARPRPQREPTEDIPAPSGEQEWTDQQIEALVWGLKAFRGRDRYQNILHAPEAKGLLRGRSDLDLMQQALYIKQSMARAMETGVLPNGQALEDDWTWLMSVPG
jgi:hypothetical protein